MTKRSVASASLQVHDLAAQGVRLPLLEIGSPNIIDPAASWVRLDDVNGIGVFVSHFSGTSPWEKHGADEFLYMVRGEAKLTLVVDLGEVERRLKQGCAFVVPKNVRHRLNAPVPSILLSLTPT
jgi:mannose-6-phosphate isomerase-like protein (cupin superfamily)